MAVLYKSDRDPNELSHNKDTQRQKFRREGDEVTAVGIHLLLLLHTFRSTIFHRRQEPVQILSCFFVCADTPDHVHTRVDKLM